MRAWQVTARGEPGQVLELRDVPVPEPGPGELRIRVDAAALGLPDVLMCRGSYAFEPALPFTPGQEVVGSVTATSAGGPALGSRVMAVTAFFKGHGGFAEEALALEASTHPAPDTMADSEAAGFVIPFHTAWLGLVRRGALQPGETLVVHGAAGGSGAAAVALASALGARVIAVAGGPAKVALCRQLGAAIVVDHAEADFVEAVREATGGRGADVIYDPVGGKTFERSLNCVASEGRLLAIGYASGAWADASTAKVVMRNCSVVGVYVGAFAASEVSAAHAQLLKLHASGGLPSVVTREVRFEEIPQALGEVAGRRALGKTIARIGS